MTIERNYSAQFQDASNVDRYEEIIYREGSHDDIIWQVEQILLDKLIRNYFPASQTAEAMDFACGSGRITRFLHQNQGRLVGSLVGVDISPQMLEKAHPKVGDVELLCADIVNSPEAVPGNKDIITCFRFLLLAEPALRDAVINQLVRKLRDDNSILIFSLHGNPKSFRALARLRDRLFAPGKPPLPRYGLKEMQELAARVGMQIVGATGTGYIPHTLARILPRKLFFVIERALAGRPIIWQFGTNLLVACKRT